MSLLHEEDDHKYQYKRSNKGTEGRQILEPEKVHLTGEFVILAKFGDHVLCHLAF